MASRQMTVRGFLIFFKKWKFPLYSWVHQEAGGGGGGRGGTDFSFSLAMFLEMVE